MHKKVITICIVFLFLLICVFNVNAYSVINITMGIETSTQTLGTGNKITSIDDRNQTIEDAENGVSVTLTFSDTGTSTHCGLATALIVFTFPESKYVQGQSYNFSFSLAGSQSNNDTLVYIPYQDYYTTNTIKVGTLPFWYEVGDTVPQWSTVINEITPTAGFDDDRYNPVLYKTDKLYNNSSMSADFTIPSNYVENVYSITDGTLQNSFSNRITICLVMRTNYRGTEIKLNNITLTPIGSTRALYADFEHNEQVEEDLSDIKNSLDELLTQDEKEAEVAGSSGNEAIDGLMSGIENKGTGFFNALGNLISSMSYSGTECKWKLPAMFIPAIDGVIDKTQLTPEMDIDFEFWVNSIPENILSVVRAVLTIALIIFCFRELYGVLSYVFTLKGG